MKASRKCFVGSKVWVRVDDESRVFELGEVTHISADRKYSVETATGQKLEIELGELTVTHEHGCRPVEDLLNLSDYCEESLLHSLRERYHQDEFYSMVGPILISINPYKWCDIYSKEHMGHYRGKCKAQVAAHVFLTAENAYRAVVNCKDKQSQAIIISGESGAGKTEATKIIMQYLSSAGRQFSDDGAIPESARGPASLEQRLLDSHPLLEAFGNAKTVRNDNSSRFGKFIEIEIEQTGLIGGAKVINYLLEKSRIIGQSEGERNYHVFYQMLRGADNALLEEVGLVGADAAEHKLAYVQTGSDLTLFDENDVGNFQRTCACMESIGVTVAERTEVFRTLAGVLLLGQVVFDKADDLDSCTCAPLELGKAAAILGLEPADLQNALCSDVVAVGGESIHKPVGADTARDKRDALAKALYALLFRWLVVRINASLARSAAEVPGSVATASTLGGGTHVPQLRRAGSLGSVGSVGSSTSTGGDVSRHCIGILDIYGFEVFDCNSFEQFCINFANEKLQRHFNKHIFEVEQEMYSKEGIDWSRIEFNDNQACLDLVDSSRVSLFCLLDEECLMPKGSDHSLLRKLHSHHKDRHENYHYPRFGNDTAFGVNHYAGVVEYNVEGFLQKNNDSLSEGLSSIMQSSLSPWFQSLFGVRAGRRNSSSSHGGAQGSASAKQRMRKRAQSLRPPTVSEQFRKQLTSLVRKLESCAPHFIRCIKPNNDKLPSYFHSLKCLQQLRYAGMLETIRIRDQGYALREPHAAFFRRFRVLGPATRSCTELVRHVTRSFGFSDASQWQMGNTKVFLRRELADLLERTATLRVAAAARQIARCMRAAIRRKHKTAMRVIEAFYDRVKFVCFMRSVVVVQQFARCVLAKWKRRRRAAEAAALAEAPARVEAPAQPLASPQASDSGGPFLTSEQAERQAERVELVEAATVVGERRRCRRRSSKQGAQAAAVLALIAHGKQRGARQSDSETESEDEKRYQKEKCFKYSTRETKRKEEEPSTPAEDMEDVQGKRVLEDAALVARTKAAWIQREALVVSRLSDLQGFVRAVFKHESSALASPSPAPPPTAPQIMEHAVDEIVRAVQQRIRLDEEAKREMADTKARVRVAEEMARLHKEMLAQAQKDAEEQAALHKEILTQAQYDAEEQVSLHKESMMQAQHDAEEQSSIHNELLVQVQHDAAAALRGAKADKAAAEAAGAAGAEKVAETVKKEETIGVKEAAENASSSKEMPSSITSLMKENIALMDEIVETRSRHNSVLRRLAQAESRVEHAEQANETLCTLLSWRDEQMQTLLDSTGASEGRTSPMPMSPMSPILLPTSPCKLEAAVRSIEPYLQGIASKYETKLERTARRVGSKEEVEDDEEAKIEVVT